MYLEQLKKEYPLVYQRVEEQTSTPSKLTSILADVNNTLSWSNTTEGSDFWDAVYYENWVEAKRLCPDLFIPVGVEKPPYKIVTNGLFKN